MRWRRVNSRERVAPSAAPSAPRVQRCAARSGRRFNDYLELSLEGLRHVDVGLATAVRVGHQAGHNVSQLAVKEEWVPLPEVAKTGDVARNVSVEINLRQRRLIVVVVGAERRGQATSLPRLVLKGVDERPPDSLKTPVFRHHDRMQLPHAASVLAEPADPPCHLTVL